MSITPYMPVYRRHDITMQRGQGVYLYDESGHDYLDFSAGIGVNSLGHGHEALNEALKEQADELWLCSNYFRHTGLEQFCSRMVEYSFADTVFCCSSGTEAVEAAIKFIRRTHYAEGDTKRNRIITFTGGFHGRTLGALSAADDRAFTDGFEPLLDGFDRAEFNDLASVEALITDKTAGIMLEPIQGEGGVRVASDAFMKGLRTLCDQHGILLFLDEIQCGMGRPGKLFAYEHYGIKPDVVTIAKGIGAGFPLAACLMTERVGQAVPAGSHGSTYGSNPLAMAVGNVVLNYLSDADFLANVRETGDYLASRLESLVAEYSDIYSEVRGRGLMRGLVVNGDARALGKRLLLEQRLIVAPSYGNVLRLLPPLIVSQEECDVAIEKLKEGTRGD